MPPISYLESKFYLYNCWYKMIWWFQRQWADKFHKTHFYYISIKSLIGSLSHSVQFSCSVVSDSSQPHGLQHARPPCPSPTPGVYSNSCSLSQWCHPTISSPIVPFSSHLQSFPASGSLKWVSSSHQVAKVLELQLQLQHQSFQWIFRTYFL